MENKILEKALLILNDRRTKAVSENEMRIQEINIKVPQIKEINNMLFNTSKELIKIINSHENEEVKNEIIEQTKRNNLDAQILAENLLQENGYPSDYLNIHFNCQKCHDTGYNGNKFCECLQKLCGTLMAQEINSNSQLSLSTFGTFSLGYYKGDDYITMRKILNYAREYIRNFSSDSESILFFGKTGLGKTHLSLAIANVVIQKGYSVLYDSAINILRNIEKEHFSHEYTTEIADLVMDTDLLIIDDLGTEYETKFYSSTVYNIINTRLNKNKPTIISTNMDFEAIKRRYDERVVSRLTSMYTCLEFKGEDVRLQIKYKNVPNK